MKRQHQLAVLVALFSSLASVPSFADEPVERFAVIVGANDGGGDRPQLKYAVKDADTIRGVFRSMGGLSSSGHVYLADPAADAVREAIAAVGGKAAQARAGGARVEFFFFYSGHADENGLLLSGEAIPYREVRSAVEGVDANVRVVILDACSSGAITRSKGGRRKPPFMVDESHHVTGHAFLTASAPDEAAQESDHIELSFFTHFLVSGLRGAADRSGDGKVTLTEAYQFAFDETLRRTENTVGGAQHPGYDIQLAGQGDLVLTDVRLHDAELAFDANIDGRLFVRDANGSLVAELFKPGGRSISLGLMPQRYEVSLAREGRFYVAEVTLQKGRVASLALGAFEESEAAESAANSKGDSGPNYEYLAVGFDLFPFVGTSSSASRDAVRHISFNLGGGYSAGIAGAELAAGVNINRDFMHGAQLAGGVNYVGETVKGVQVAGGVNFVGRRATGLQIAGGANYATEHVGLQVAPLNVGGDVTGMQFGVVNIARKSDYSFGVLNIIYGGRLHLSSWLDSGGFGHVGLKHGGDRFHTTYFASYTPFLAETFGYGLAFGVRPLDRERFFVDIEVIGQQVIESGDFEGTNSRLGARGVFGYRITPDVALVAGPSLDITLTDGAHDFEPTGPRLFSSDGAELDVIGTPGLMLGVDVF